MANTFIIINHYRSGSNFLCRLLKTNSNIRCLNEPLSLHTNILKKIDLQIMNEQNMQSIINENIGCAKLLKELKQYIYESIYSVGFKETVLFGKMKWVLSYFPDVRIIYLVRNPIAVVNSMLKNDIWKQWKNDITIPRFLKSNCIDYKIESTLDFSVLSWKIRYSLFKKEMDSRKFYMLKLEDFILNPNKTLIALMDYIGEVPCEEQLEFIEQLYFQTKGNAYWYYVKKKYKLKVNFSYNILFLPSQSFHLIQFLFILILVFIW